MKELDVEFCKGGTPEWEPYHRKMTKMEREREALLARLDEDRQMGERDVTCSQHRSNQGSGAMKSVPVMDMTNKTNVGELRLSESALRLMKSELFTGLRYELRLSTRTDEPSSDVAYASIIAAPSTVKEAVHKDPVPTNSDWAEFTNLNDRSVMVRRDSVVSVFDLGDHSRRRTVLTLSSGTSVEVTEDMGRVMLRLGGTS